jgi:hypothetical protein
MSTTLTHACARVNSRSEEGCQASIFLKKFFGIFGVFGIGGSVSRYGTMVKERMEFSPYNMVA